MKIRDEKTLRYIVRGHPALLGSATAATPDPDILEIANVLSEQYAKLRAAWLHRHKHMISPAKGVQGHRYLVDLIMDESDEHAAYAEKYGK